MGLFDKLAVMMASKQKRTSMNELEELAYLCNLIEAKGINPTGPNADALTEKMVNELRPRLHKFQELHPKYDVEQVKEEFRKVFVGK